MATLFRPDQSFRIREHISSQEGTCVCERRTMTKQNQISSSEDRTTPATIVVVTPDLTLLKLVDMALKLELNCEMLGFTSARNAEITMQSLLPDLVILDEQFSDDQMHNLADQLQSAQIPILFINALESTQNLDSLTISLDPPWKVEAFYRAVHLLLGHTP